MKKLIFLIMFCQSILCFGQTTHAVSVAVNQPPVCTVVSVEKNLFEEPSIYPNPAKDIIYLTTSEPDFTVEVYDALGRQITKENFTSAAKGSLDVSSFSRGIYRVMIVSRKKVFQSKVIVE